MPSRTGPIGSRPSRRCPRKWRQTAIADALAHLAFADVLGQQAEKARQSAALLGGDVHGVMLIQACGRDNWRNRADALQQRLGRGVGGRRPMGQDAANQTGTGKEIVVGFEAIKNNIKVCMFDQYGTVVDMQVGLTAIATPFLKAKGWSGNPNAFVTWWRRTHFENSMIDALLQREHTPYREIGHRAVAHVMDRAGIEYSREDVRYLVGEIEKLKPFPEVPAALDKLHTRYKLVVLSNGDPDMLETAKRYHKVPFDKVISVAEANSFKPHVATYTKAAELCGLKPEQILFVANHAFDCIGAKSAGMKTAFIDRRSRPFGETPHQPDILVPTMQDLADAIV
jgi:2-haloacid dehalogenase